MQIYTWWLIYWYYLVKIYRRLNYLSFVYDPFFQKISDGFGLDYLKCQSVMIQGKHIIINFRFNTKSVTSLEAFGLSCSQYLNILCKGFQLYFMRYCWVIIIFFITDIYQFIDSFGKVVFHFTPTYGLIFTS